MLSLFVSISTNPAGHPVIISFVAPPEYLESLVLDLLYSFPLRCEDLYVCESVGLFETHRQRSLEVRLEFDSCLLGSQYCSL